MHVSSSYYKHYCVVHHFFCGGQRPCKKKLDNRAHQDNGIIIIRKKTIRQFIFCRARPRDRFMSSDVCNTKTRLSFSFLLTKKKRKDKKKKQTKNTYENENQQPMREKDRTKEEEKVYQNTERRRQAQIWRFYAPNNSQTNTQHRH
jgi:hypothetical protein